MWEAFVDCLQESVTDVSGNVGAVRWVKSYYVPVSRALMLWWLWVEIEIVVVSASYEGLLVRGNSCVERLLIRRDVRQPSVDGLWYAAEY